MRQLLWVFVALAACDKGATSGSGTCKDVVTKARGTFDMRLERAENLVGNCELSAWNETTKTCVGKAKSQNEINACLDGVAGAPKRMNNDAAMRAMTAFKDQMCACKDAACAQHVSDEMTTWAQQQAKDNAEPPKMSEEDTKAFTQLGEEMGKCMQRAMEPVDAAPTKPNAIPK